MPPAARSVIAVILAGLLYVHVVLRRGLEGAENEKTQASAITDLIRNFRNSDNTQRVTGRISSAAAALPNKSTKAPSATEAPPSASALTQYTSSDSDRGPVVAASLVPPEHLFMPCFHDYSRWHPKSSARKQGLISLSVDYVGLRGWACPADATIDRDGRYVKPKCHLERSWVKGGLNRRAAYHLQDIPCKLADSRGSCSCPLWRHPVADAKPGTWERPIHSPKRGYFGVVFDYDGGTYAPPLCLI